MKRFSKGFTLIEMLIVITLVGILSAFLFANINQGSAQSRDVKRQADLRNLQSAIELYKNQEGRYPEGCNTANTWSGQLDTDYSCTDGTGQYIQGLAPEFIGVLPTDPKLNGESSGYAYLTNSNGTVYKLVAFRTVEELIFSLDNNGVDPALVPEQSAGFRLCNFYNSGRVGEYCSGGIGYVDYRSSGGCDILNSSNNTDFINSFALWGGFAEGSSDQQVRQNTESIICTKPN